MYDQAHCMTVKFFHKESGTHFASIENRLQSANGNSVEVHNNIPRFVKSSGYASAFGAQWNRFKKLQLDSYTHTDFTRRRLERCIGGTLESCLKGKIVLEAGSGAGRFTELLAPHCKHLYTFDLSNAIDANYENNRSDNITFFQADLLDIPFGDESFDMVVCLGVIQHSPDSEKAIKELWRVVRPGGVLVADHYHFRWAYYTTAIPFFRLFLRHLPPYISMKIVKFLVNVFFPLHWRFRHSKAVTWILGHISPLLTNIDAFEDKGYEFNKDTAFLETYDTLTDYYKRLISKEALQKIILNLPNVSQFDIQRGGNGWEFRIHKANNG